MSARFYTAAVLFLLFGSSVFAPPLQAQGRRPQVRSLVDDNTAQGLVDLKNKPGGREVNNLLKGLAQGNEGDGGLKSLTFNSQTGEVRGDGFVRHKHVWKYGPRWAPQTQTVYDWTWEGSFAFNPKNGSGHATLDLGRGVKLDTKRIERLLHGDLGALLEMIPNGGLAEKVFRNEYDMIKADYERRYGPGNVYFASPRFVDWAKPETAGEWVIRAAATGGVDTGRIMSEVSRQTLAELQDVARWMQSKGLREAQSTAQAVLSGQRVSWPYLAVKWQTVGYFSRDKVLGRFEGPEIRSTHAAFVIIWQGNLGGNDVPGGNNVPGQNPGNRIGSQFRYSAGTFINQGNGRWIEQRDSSLPSQFVERGRTMELVQLYDAQRHMTVRLSVDHAEFKAPNTQGAWRRWPGSEGQWIR